MIERHLPSVTPGSAPKTRRMRRQRRELPSCAKFGQMRRQRRELPSCAKLKQRRRQSAKPSAASRNLLCKRLNPLTVEVVTTSLPDLLSSQELRVHLWRTSHGRTCDLSNEMRKAFETGVWLKFEPDHPRRPCTLAQW